MSSMSPFCGLNVTTTVSPRGGRRRRWTRGGEIRHLGSKVHHHEHGGLVGIHDDPIAVHHFKSAIARGHKTLKLITSLVWPHLPQHVQDCMSEETRTGLTVNRWRGSYQHSY